MRSSTEQEPINLLERNYPISGHKKSLILQHRVALSFQMRSKADLLIAGLVFISAHRQLKLAFSALDWSQKDTTTSSTMRNQHAAPQSLKKKSTISGLEKNTNS